MRTVMSRSVSWIVDVWSLLVVRRMNISPPEWHNS
jgi:hypothetical protein